MSKVAPIDHPVSRYAIDVVEGKIIAGSLVKLACERHLMDLETAADRGFYFDVDAANMIINFAPMLRHFKGPMAGKPITLEPWQMFRHGSVFGWKREEDGKRRFREAYNQIAKKNGKTTDTIPPALFSLLFDGEASPEVYCTATTSGQAGILFKGMKAALRNSPNLMQLARPMAHEISAPIVDGMVKCLSRDSSAADGLNPHFAARDELHLWTDRELADIVRNSMIARSQPIDWAITTAGADLGGICGELRLYSERVLRGDVEDDTLFAYVSEPDAKLDDPADPKTWAKANPNFGVSVTEAAMRELLRKAEAVAGRMPAFRRYHLNLWTEGAEEWITRDVWDEMKTDFRLSDLHGRKAWLGVDLSRTTDLTAVCLAVPVDGRIFLKCWSMLPDGPKGFIARAKTENREYIAWRDQGNLIVHRGGSIDNDQVIELITSICKQFDVQEIAYDRWGMPYIAKELTKRGLPLLEHGQGYASMSAPTKRFEGAVANKQIAHDGDPCLAWAIGNVKLDSDPAENVKPNKKKSGRRRIDPAVAAIMAFGRAELEMSKKKTRRRVVV